MIAVLGCARVPDCRLSGLVPYPLGRSGRVRLLGERGGQLGRASGFNLPDVTLPDAFNPTSRGLSWAR